MPKILKFYTNEIYDSNGCKNKYLKLFSIEKRFKIEREREFKKIKPSKFQCIEKQSWNSARAFLYF